MITSQVRHEVQVLTDSINTVFSRLPNHYISEDNISDINLLQKFRLEFQSKVRDEELIFIYKNKYSSKVKIEALEEIYKRKNIDKLRLFKETIPLKDTIHSISKEQIYLVQSDFFDRITDNEKDIELMNDLIINIFKSEPVNIPLIENIIYKIPKTPEYYERIRNLTIESKSKYLLNYIATFKNKKDIKLIEGFGIDALSAIEIFRNEEFIPFLESLFEKESSNYAYLITVSKFCKNKKSIKLINEIFEDFEKNKNNYKTNLFISYLQDNKCRNK